MPASRLYKPETTSAVSWAIVGTSTLLRIWTSTFRGTGISESGSLRASRRRDSPRTTTAGRMRSVSRLRCSRSTSPAGVCAATFVEWGSRSHHTRRSASRSTTIPRRRLSSPAATGRTDTESPLVEWWRWKQVWQFCPHKSAWKPPGLDEGCPDSRGKGKGSGKLLWTVRAFRVAGKYIREIRALASVPAR